MSTTLTSRGTVRGHFPRCRQLTRDGAPCQHACLPGRDYCYSHQPVRPHYRWTPARRARLLSLSEDGLPADAIGEALNVSPRAVVWARQRYGIQPPGDVLLTPTEIGRRMGVSPHGQVVRWIADGFLVAAATPERRRHGAPTYCTEAAILDFLGDATAWHLFEPAVIRHEPWRRWAERARGDERFLSTTEVARQLCCSDRTVTKWCRRGLLPARRIGKRYCIAASDLARFCLPTIGGTR